MHSPDLPPTGGGVNEPDYMLLGASENSALDASATESLRRARDDLAGTVQELERSNEALHAENADRMRAEEALRNAQADLARVARLTTMGELAASIAHEVNQPLMAVVTNADTCLR